MDNARLVRTTMPTQRSVLAQDADKGAVELHVASPIDLTGCTGVYVGEFGHFVLNPRPVDPLPTTRIVIFTPGLQRAEPVGTEVVGAVGVPEE